MAAAGIAGFPYVHAQEKITLRYLGTAVNQSADIAKKFKEDTGIEIQYIPVTTDDVAKRIITQPNSFDIVDTEYFSLKKLIPAGTLAGMDAKRIKLADKITPVLTKGEVNGKKIGDQGTAPKKVMFLKGARSTEFSVDAHRMDDADPDDLQRGHARHSPRPDQAARYDSGRTCSIRSSRARRRC